MSPTADDTQYSEDVSLPENVDDNAKEEILFDAIRVNLCPYLGIKSKRKSAVGFPSNNHYCFRPNTPKPPTKSHQETYCLRPEHTECSVYLRPATEPFPKEFLRPGQGILSGAGGLPLTWSLLKVRIIGRMRSRPKLTAVIAIGLLILIISGFNFLPQIYRSVRFAYLTRNVELAIQKEPAALELALTNGQAYTLQRDVETGVISGSSCNGSVPVYGVLHTWSSGLHLVIEGQHYHFDENGRWTSTNNQALTAQGNWVAGCDPSTALEAELEPELIPESELDNTAPQFSGSIKLNRSLFDGYNITSVYTDDSVTGDFCYNDFTTPYFDPRTRPNIYIYIQDGPEELNGLYLITFVKWIHFNETGIVEDGSTNYFSDSDC